MEATKPIEKPGRIFGQAQQLGLAVSREVDHSRRPVPMDTIRLFAQITALLPRNDEDHCEFTERHYRVYSQWYSEFIFPDGSSITFGHEEV